MAAAYPFALVYGAMVTLTQSFLILFLPNFKYGLLPSNSNSSSKTGFVRKMIKKMADKMAACYQFALVYAVVVTLNQSFLIRFVPYFKYGGLPSNSRLNLNTFFSPNFFKILYIDYLHQTIVYV